MLPMKTQGATIPTTMNWRSVPRSISSGSGSPVDPRGEQAGGRVVGRVERLLLAHRDDRARDVVERQARPLHALGFEALHRVDELPGRLADRHPQLGRQVEELGEDVTGQAVGELGAEVPAAGRDQRVEQVGDDPAQRGLDRRHLRRGEVGVQRAPVGRVLGRVEMERRPAAREREPRDDVLNRRREQLRVARSGQDVLVAEKRPEAVPGLAACDRAAAAELGELGVEGVERLRLERVEVRSRAIVDGRRGHSSTSSIARLGQASTASRTAASCSGVGSAS